MTVAELLNDMAIKAGIPADDQGLKTLLSNADLSKVALSDKLSETIQSNLFTIDAAIASPKVTEALQKKVEAQILNGVDASLESMMEKLALDPDAVSEIKKAEKTYKRITLLSDKLKAAMDKKAATPAKDGDSAALTQQINDLKAQLAAEKTAAQQLVQAEAQKFEQKEQDMAFDYYLAQYDYANDGGGDPMVKRANVMATKALLQEKAASVGAKYVFKNGQFALVKAEDGTDFYDGKTNTKVEFKQFVEQGIAPLLKVTDPNAGKGAGAGTGGSGSEGPTFTRGSSRSLDAVSAEISG